MRLGEMPGEMVEGVVLAYEPLKAFDKRKQAIMQYVIEERVRQVV